MLATESEKEVAVIDYFLNQDNNSVPAIAEALGLTQNTVNRILNSYLSSKTIQNDK